MTFPWCIAHDKLHYTRYLTPYHTEMNNLFETNTNVHVAFKQGLSSIQLSKDKPFRKIPVETTTEVIVNKDTQIPAGTIDLQACNCSTLLCQVHYAKYRSAFLGQLRDMV